MFNLILSALVVLAVFAAIAAWLNTQTMLRDLEAIKKKLDIQEEKPKDLDND
ncbi:hypothetical protein [Alkalicoccus saliphilus]|jgi:hypothetical protein|uniref:hypothetical protein n=1 Tax=Alkalicoccus saliphilus TaxID=200989 RepID=UPI00135A059B|nr:hypothetical protein [Alkalicoccus saliphilus]